jgi:molybdenum-dependent DNA-binding transcriptional regulator ModE
MKVLCPYCGQSVTIKGLGRKPSEIGVKNILDALISTRSIAEAAKQLKCSRGHIYGILKANGLIAKKLSERN